MCFAAGALEHPVLVKRKSGQAPIYSWNKPTAGGGKNI